MVHFNGLPHILEGIYKHVSHVFIIPVLPRWCSLRQRLPNYWQSSISYLEQKYNAPAMPSPDYSTSVGKLIVLQETRNNYDPVVNYEWVNKPGLAISIRQSQSEMSLLYVDTSLLKYLAELLQSAPLNGW